MKPPVLAHHNMAQTAEATGPGTVEAIRKGAR